MTIKRKWLVKGKITLSAPSRGIKINAETEGLACQYAAYAICEMGEGEVYDDDLSAVCVEEIGSR